MLFGVTGRRSGNANVEMPSPPYVVPISENSAVFWLIGRICPFAATPPMIVFPAVKRI